MKACIEMTKDELLALSLSLAKTSEADRAEGRAAKDVIEAMKTGIEALEEAARRERCTRKGGKK